jgi:hypothetical protein
MIIGNLHFLKTQTTLELNLRWFFVIRNIIKLNYNKPQQKTY